MDLEEVLVEARDALDSYREHNHGEYIDTARVKYTCVLELVESRPIQQRTVHDYRAAIEAQRGMLSLGIKIKTDYEKEALERGFLTQERIDSIE